MKPILKAETNQTKNFLNFLTTLFDIKKSQTPHKKIFSWIRLTDRKLCIWLAFELNPQIIHLHCKIKMMKNVVRMNLMVMMGIWLVYILNVIVNLKNFKRKLCDILWSSLWYLHFEVDISNGRVFFCLFLR